MAARVPGEVVLSPVELATIQNTERMLEVVIDLLDAQRMAPRVLATPTVLNAGVMLDVPLACPNCLQLNQPEQARDGRCFICGTRLL